ncbi:MAG: cyclic nucleotide-binding domain-containing protein [bacterium]
MDVSIIQIIVVILLWFGLGIVIFRYTRGAFLLQNRFILHLLNFFFWLWFCIFFLFVNSFIWRFHKLLGGIVLFILAYLAVDFVDWVLSGRFSYPRTKKKIPGVLRNIIKFLLLIIFILGILHYHFNIALTGISITSAVLAGILGFALQETLGNLLSGIALNMDSPFKHGDWVQVGDDEGWVVDISWRSTTIHTREDDIVVVPNSVVSSSRLINYSRPQRWRALKVEVGVAYDSSPAIVKKIMKSAAEDSRYIRKEPEPKCWLMEFQDFSIRYCLKFWVRDYTDAYDAADDVRTRIWYAFRRNDIEIPFPIRVLKNYKSSAADDETRYINIFNILREVDLFKPLTDEDLEILSRGVERTVYGKGDIIIHQNDLGSSMFVVVRGDLSVEVMNKWGNYQKIGELSQGAIVGEMSLLTGEKRSATVRALTEVELIVINKNAFGQILIKNPKIAEHLSSMLARRKEEIQTKTTDGISQDDEQTQHDRTSILHKMQYFFGLTRK